jgi:hypothetical protein
MITSKSWLNNKRMGIINLCLSNRVIKKESHKTLTDSDSSSSSDDEENKDMNRITSYRGNTNGSSKPKSQRINNNEEFSNSDLNTDVQMELTNSTDFKAPSEDNNWADFGKFSNNQVCCY